MIKNLLIVLLISAFGNISHAQIVAWQFGSPASSGDEVTYQATTNNTNLSTSILSRGGGILPTALVRAFSANDWTLSGTKALAKTNNDYFQTSIKSNSGFKFSLSTLDARMRRTATGPNAYIWTYSTDGTNFIEIGSDVSFTSTSDGVNQATIDLSSISALQDVPSTTTVTFRLFGWGATMNSGTFAIGRFGTGITTNSLAFGGTVTNDAPGCTPPSAQATGFVGSSATETSMNISWTDAVMGGGDKVIVLAHANTAVNGNPVNGTAYNMPSSIYGNGDLIPTGNYVVYNGTGTSLTVTGLTAGTTYHYAIYEYNSAENCYLIPGLIGSYATMAAPSSQYRSLLSGDWNIPSNWESSTDNGMTWIVATSFPTNADDLIAIRNSNHMTMSSNKTVDQLTIEAGGSLEILAGQLTINNGPSAEDLIINGSLINSSTPSTTIAVNSGAVVSVNNGGLYQHNTISNVYPILTWNAGSTLEVKAMTTGGFASSNLNQVFANFTWNIPGQTAVANLSGNLKNVTGNFSVLATGATNIRLIGNTTTIDVGGDFIVSSGAQVDFSQSGSSSFATLNLKGNMVINGNITETSPAAGYGIVKFSNTSTQQTITLGDPDLSITENISLEIANPNGVILLSNLSLNYEGNLILNSGTIRTNGFSITAVAPAAVVGGNSTSFVCNCDASGMTLGTGALLMDIAPSNVKIFPVGPTPTLYMPATLTGNAGTSYDYFSVRVDPLGSNGVTPTYPTQCITYQWQIDASSPASNHDINLTLQWAAGTEGSTFNPNSNLVIGHWNGTKFNMINNATYNASNPSATSTLAFTSFSPFVVASGFSPLPINLLNFTATKTNSGVQLVWNTANEVNNKYFDVEKSTNGIEFESIATIQGKNQLSASYTYIDKEVKSGKYFYRLNQTDFDGANTLSKIVTVNYSDKNIEVYPTITKDLVRVETEISNWNYEIFDINGNLKLSGSRSGAGSLDFTAYSKGIYFIKIIGDETNTYKIIKY